MSTNTHMHSWRCINTKMQERFHFHLQCHKEEVWFRHCPVQVSSLQHLLQWLLQQALLAWEERSLWIALSLFPAPQWHKKPFIEESVTCKKLWGQITQAVKSELHCNKKFGPELGFTFSVFTVVQIYSFKAIS